MPETKGLQENRLLTWTVGCKTPSFCCCFYLLIISVEKKSYKSSRKTILLRVDWRHIFMMICAGTFRHDNYQLIKLVLYFNKSGHFSIYPMHNHQDEEVSTKIVLLANPWIQVLSNAPKVKWANSRSSIDFSDFHWHHLVQDHSSEFWRLQDK